MEGFLNPEKILKEELNLSATMTAADFGAGSGGWAIPLAQILQDGRVIAVDILSGPLSALTSQAKLSRILNIQTEIADVTKGTKIAPGFCDLVLMTNVLFQCGENKNKVLEEGKRVLRNGGKILVIEWKKSANFGPRERAVSLEDIKKLAEEAGLKVAKEFEASPYHYGIILVK